MSRQEFLFTSSLKGSGLRTRPFDLHLQDHQQDREYGIFQQGNDVIGSFFRMITLRREPRGQKAKEQEALVTIIGGMTRA